MTSRAPLLICGFNGAIPSTLWFTAAAPKIYGVRWLDEGDEDQ
jgi:hypothetical protein